MKNKTKQLERESNLNYNLKGGIFNIEKKSMNKKGVFGLNAVQQFFVIILGIALLAFIIVVIMGTLSGTTILPVISASVIGEAGSANTTGYTLDSASITRFSNPVITALSNRSDEELINNEVGGYLNTTGYTLAESTRIGFTTPVIVQISNYTDGEIILSGNYTLTGNILTNTSATTWNNISINYTWTNVLLVGNASVSSVGVVTNGSTTEWNNLSISYTYNRESLAQGQLDDILGNTSTGITGFFSSITPVYAILAVLVIILVLVVLVRVVQTPGSGREAAVQL